MDRSLFMPCTTFFHFTAIYFLLITLIKTHSIAILFVLSFQTHTLHWVINFMRRQTGDIVSCFVYFFEIAHTCQKFLLLLRTVQF
jgi:hypothetical protein